jgi:hypothetical protein
MAQALAAASPPLHTDDVLLAADSLTASRRPARVLDELLRQGIDLMRGRQLVEALRALRAQPNSHVR